MIHQDKADGHPGAGSMIFYASDITWFHHLRKATTLDIEAKKKAQR
jgi:hypothetical protein